MTFLYYLGLSYLAANLITVGVYHGTRLASFSRIVGSHRIVPIVFALPLAIFVAAFELVAGATALAALFSQEMAKLTGLLFSASAAIALAFILYVRQLLRHPEGIASCGCSSFASPLTKRVCHSGADVAAGIAIGPGNDCLRICSQRVWYCVSPACDLGWNAGTDRKSAPGVHAASGWR